jgi:hypothetical protein
VADVENSIPDGHLRNAKVDERWMNSLSLEAIEAGISCWNRDIQRFVRSCHISEYHPFTTYSLSRILPQLSERVHTAKENVYRVVEC